jgi:hypothetical protein
LVKKRFESARKAGHVPRAKFDKELVKLEGVERP